MVKPVTVTAQPVAVTTAPNGGGNVNNNQNNNNININMGPSAQGRSNAKTSNGLQRNVDVRFEQSVLLVAFLISVY